MSTVLQNVRRNMVAGPIPRLLLAVALVVPVVAWTQHKEPLAMQTQSRLWVEGTSSIKSFSCKATEVDATVDADGSDVVVRLLAGDKAVQGAKVTVPAASLDCGNGTMNEHMRKALKVEESPTIAFRITSYQVTKTPIGIAGDLTGTLSLGGESRTIVVPATGTAESGALRVVGTYELAMSDYKLTAPSLMFGRIKVRDKVTVKFDLVLKS